MDLLLWCRIERYCHYILLLVSIFRFLNSRNNGLLISFEFKPAKAYDVDENRKSRCANWQNQQRAAQLQTTRTTSWPLLRNRATVVMNALPVTHGQHTHKQTSTDRQPSLCDRTDTPFNQELGVSWQLWQRQTFMQHEKRPVSGGEGKDAVNQHCQAAIRWGMSPSFFFFFFFIKATETELSCLAFCSCFSVMPNFLLLYVRKCSSNKNTQYLFPLPQMLPILHQIKPLYNISSQHYLWNALI